jgi:hypothetical protein
MGSEHYRTPPEFCALIASLAPDEGVALDPWAGRPDQVNYVRAKHFIYRDRRKRLGGGGFTTPWAPLAKRGLIYNNPSYSRELLALCMQRIIEQASTGLWNTALVPASTDTGWFQRALMSADHIMLVKRRIRFVDPAIVALARRRKQKFAPTKTRKRARGDNTARFSNVVFHWAGEYERQARLERFERVMSPHGIVIPCEAIRALLCRVLDDSPRVSPSAERAVGKLAAMGQQVLRAVPGGRR